MPKLTKSEKTESCIRCSESFTKVKRHAKNMCQPCYSASIRVKAKPRPKLNYCLSCKKEYGTIGDKGKIVIQGSGNMCRLCYSRAYVTRKDAKPCQNCGRIIKNVVDSICKICDDDLKEQYYRDNPRVRKSESFKNKLMAEKIELTNEQYELIRRLLVKFSIGSQNAVDFLRVCDIYLDLFTCEVFLDSYCEQEQVIVMLKRLKTIWHKNRDIRLEKKLKKPKRKYERRLKNNA